VALLAAELVPWMQPPSCKLNGRAGGDCILLWTHWDTVFQIACVCRTVQIVYGDRRKEMMVVCLC